MNCGLFQKADYWINSAATLSQKLLYSVCGDVLIWLEFIDALMLMDACT